MNKLVDKLTIKLAKILIPVYIIVSCLSPSAAIVFADTESSLNELNSQYSEYDEKSAASTTGAEEYDSGDSWAAADFKYDSADETIITGFSDVGKDKLETNSDLVIPSKNVTGAAIKGIAKNAFKSKELTSVKFPDTVETIGNAAFSTNKISGELELPESLSSLGQQAFMKNEITHVEIPRSITVINAGVFNTNKLTEVTIHNKVSSIGLTAFAANQIETLIFEENRNILPEGIDIQKMAFGNNQLKTVHLPYNVQGIFGDSFKNNTGNDPDIEELVYLYTENSSHLTNSNIYHYDAEGSQKSNSAKLILEEKPWTAEDFSYNPDDATIITGFSNTGLEKLSGNKELEIPLRNITGNIVTAVGSGAFSNKGLTKVVFPEGLDDFTIDVNAFMNNDISEIILPEGIRNFESKCFSDNKIKSLVLPQSTLKVGNAAFDNNEITSLTISDTKEKIQIDGYSFHNNKIKSFILPNRVEKVAGTAFLNNPGMELSSAEGSGIVYMYTLNANHFNNDRIYRIGGTNSVPYQRLILKDSEISDEWKVTDFTYDGTKITGLSEDGQIKAKLSKNLVLPDVNSQGEKITEIAENAFKMDADYDGNEVNSPDGFISVAFPRELTSIGDNAFQYNNFTDLSFPKSLEHIGMMAFNGNKLTTVILPENLISMGSGAFGVNKLTTLEIDHKLSVIPTGAFTSNTTLTNLEIPEGVKEIGSSAFRGAPLKTLTISSTVEKIDDSAFILHHLGTLTIPGNVKYIGKQAFEGNPNAKTLKTLILNEGLETISKGAFNKNLLERVDLPGSVIALDSKSFVNNPTVVEVYTTNEAHKLFTADEEKSHKIMYFNPYELWAADDFIYEGTTLTGFSELGKTKTSQYRYVVLPDINPQGDRITEISKDAFVPDGYYFVKEEVFSPNGLNKVVLPKYVEVIDERAFQYNNLTTVEFPGSLNTLKLQCFNGNKLQKLVIPDTVTNIEDGVFSTNNLTDVTLPNNMKIIPKGLFARNITLQHIEIPYGVEIIDDYAFNGAQLKTLKLPDSVIEIRRGAFYYHQLKELEIPGSVKVLGHRAFSGTTKAIRLENLVLNEGLEEIGSEAFAVGLLKEVYLPNSLEKLDTSSFDHNTGYEGSGKVNLYTYNKEHLNFPESESYSIIYLEDSNGGGSDENGNGDEGNGENNNSGGGNDEDNNDGNGGGENNGSSGRSGSRRHISKPVVKTPSVVLPEETSGGKIVLSDDKKTIKIVPDDGYEIDDLIIDGKSVGPLNFYKFTDDKEHTVDVVFKEKQEKIGVSTFTDVDNHWAKDAIDYVVAHGLFHGISDTEFAPDNPMTRSMLVTVLYRYEKNPEINSSTSFKDADGSTWYSDGVVWAADANIVKGITEDLFAPNENLTREQLITILYRYAQYKGIDVTASGDLNSYADSSEVSDWSSTAVKWAVSTGLLQGRGSNLLAPADDVTRGEAATFLARFIGRNFTG